jgi:hypothetical protein
MTTIRDEIEDARKELSRLKVLRVKETDKECIEYISSKIEDAEIFLNALENKAWRVGQ